MQAAASHISVSRIPAAASDAEIIIDRWVELGDAICDREEDAAQLHAYNPITSHRFLSLKLPEATALEYRSLRHSTKHPSTDVPLKNLYLFTWGLYRKQARIRKAQCITMVMGDCV